MRPAIVLIALSVCVGPAAAQEPKGAKPADKAEPVPGRKIKKIEGFTFFLSEEAANIDPAKYERPPMEVLERECKALTKMLSPKALDVLRKLTIWVDWDAKVPYSNGRPGNAIAMYYPDTPQQSAAGGRHVLQAKTVTIHSLKAMTEYRQPKNDNMIWSIFLHELAHAVHDQLLGFDHAGVKAMYEQAMERRLYEKEFYATTNHIEFFAETSCAYLDALPHYPHNRADLKKHDPVTFKTLESVWTGAKGSGTPPTPAHSAKVSLDISLKATVQFGEAVLGEKPAADRLAGKVVVIGFWGYDFSNVLGRMDKLSAELAPYGLVVICPYAYKGEPDEIKGLAEKRGARGTVLKVAWVKEPGAPEGLSPSGGHAMVFGPDGKCLYRGSAYDADDAARAAIGQLLLTTAVGPGEVPKAFKPVADAFDAGAGPVAAYPKVAALLGSADADTKAAAKKLADLILAPGQKMLDDAQAAAKADPVRAFLAAEKVATGFKNTPLAAKATTLTMTLRADRTVAAELKARAIVTDMEKLVGKLRAQEGSFSPSDPKFQSKNQQALAQLKTQIEQLRKVHPSARATAEAEKIAREFDVN